uniref:Uncharacterized protein n=1 Tax=Rhizophora mucronata TaxID=61149 RepID=A0A2P2Q4V3_RHIMU
MLLLLLLLLLFGKVLALLHLGSFRVCDQNQTGLCFRSAAYVVLSGLLF